MGAAPIRLIFAVAVLALAFAESDGCGYTPEDLKGEGEPCTRSSECESSLSCRGGVCMIPPSPVEDAGAPRDAGSSTDFDAGSDAGSDAGEAPVDGGDLDAAAPDAQPPDAAGSSADASSGA